MLLRRRTGVFSPGGGLPAATTALAFAGALLLAGCGGSHRPTAQQEVRNERAEQHDVDRALSRDRRAAATIDRYHIENEVLTVVVDARAWRRLGLPGQDAFKRKVWGPWRLSYVRHHPGTTERVFLKVEDLAANDLGSYFEP